MDVLKRSLAPITDAAWKMLVEEAQAVLRPHLSARRIVDVSGPHGIDYAAVNLGRLEVPESAKDEVRYGIRKVLPLVEVRAPFEVDIWELDNIDRGSEDPQLNDLQRAAKAIAKFEEQAVFEGFAEAGISGLLESSEYDEPVTLEAQASALPEAIGRAALRLKYAGVEGPYALALGAALYTLLDTGCDVGYPMRRRIGEQLGGPVVLAPYLTGGVLISRRGGDAEMVIGQDLSIGYQSHDGTTARLFLSESFTFRVLGPEAHVMLQVEGAS
jgi:uncharacterized linocin/CFP29 family protein